MQSDTRLPSSLLRISGEQATSDPIWPVTSFSLHRNIAGYSFAPKISDQPYLTDHIRNTCSQIPQLQAYIFLPAEELSPHDKEFLSEHFLSEQGWQNFSKGQAFLVDPSGSFIGLLGGEEHLVLRTIDKQGNWEKVWNDLEAIESRIEEKLGFAFSEKFGYLTADPKKSGTGLIISCYLHLPCLIASGLLAPILRSSSSIASGSGITGNLDEFPGDILILRNRYTLGTDEASLLRNLYTTALRFVSTERTERLRLRNEGGQTIKDSICRAYGLLAHSYQLNTREALDALSKIKLGIDLAWIEGIEDREINTFFFRCRKAHLEEELPSEPTDLAEARARYLHEQLGKIRITIR